MVVLPRGGWLREEKGASKKGTGSKTPHGQMKRMMNAEDKTQKGVKSHLHKTYWSGWSQRNRNEWNYRIQLCNVWQKSKVVCIVRGADCGRETERKTTDSFGFQLAGDSWVNGWLVRFSKMQDIRFIEISSLWKCAEIRFSQSKLLDFCLLLSLVWKVFQKW